MFYRTLVMGVFLTGASSLGVGATASHFRDHFDQTMISVYSC